MLDHAAAGKWAGLAGKQDGGHVKGSPEKRRNHFFATEGRYKLKQAVARVYVHAEKVLCRTRVVVALIRIVVKWGFGTHFLRDFVDHRIAHEDAEHLFEIVVILADRRIVAERKTSRIAGNRLCENGGGVKVKRNRKAALSIGNQPCG